MTKLLLTYFLLFLSFCAFAEKGASDGAGGGDIEIISEGISNPAYWEHLELSYFEEFYLKEYNEMAKETAQFLEFVKINYPKSFSYFIEHIPKKYRTTSFITNQYSQLINLKEFKLVDQLPGNSDAYYNSNKKSLYILKSSLGYFSEFKHTLRFLVFHETLGLMGIQKEDALIKDNKSLKNNYPITRVFRWLYYKYWPEFKPRSFEYPLIIKDFLEKDELCSFNNNKPKFRPPDIDPRLTKEAQAIVNASACKFYAELDIIFTSIGVTTLQNLEIDLKDDWERTLELINQY